MNATTLVGGGRGILNNINSTLFDIVLRMCIFCSSFTLLEKITDHYRWHFEQVRHCQDGYWSQGWRAYDVFSRNHVFLKEFRRDRWACFGEYIKDSYAEYRRMKHLKRSSYYPQPFKYVIHKGRAYITMTYVPGRRLADAFFDCRCDRQKAVRITLNILRGIQDMHESGLYHGDVQMRNILMHGEDETTVQIVDFGQSMRRTERGSASGKISTAFWGYTPPEQYRNQFVDNSDCYGAICICVRLITGFDPFPPIHSKDEIQLVQRYVPFWDIGDENLRNVLRKALSFDPASRFKTVSDLMRALHPFG